MYLERCISSAEHHAGNAYQRVAVRCSVCCSVLQCVAVRDSVLQCVAVCCIVLQCVAVCYSVYLERFISSAEHPAGNTHQCVAVRCSVCCSVLQCMTVCCNMLQYVAVCILRGVSRVQSILPTPKVSVQGQSTIVVLRCVALCCNAAL